MKKPIDIDIQLDPACSEPKIVIRTNRMTPDIDHIIHAIENCMDSRYAMVTAYDKGVMTLLSQREIVRAFVENRKLVIQTEAGRYIARGTLAELESALNPDRFLRISRSEIINLNKVSSFDFSLSGTIHVYFDDGTGTWVARRYVRSIQAILGMA